MTLGEHDDHVKVGSDLVRQLLVLQGRSDVLVGPLAWTPADVNTGKQNTSPLSRTPAMRGTGFGTARQLEHFQLIFGKIPMIASLVKRL